MNIIKPDALISLRPNAKWTINDDVLTWKDEVQSEPTQAEIDAEIARLKSEYKANQYQRDRASQFPPIGDQLDALYHAGAFPPDMAAKIKKVKDDNPKG